MQYYIKNSKQVYIRLNRNGQATTCPKYERQSFEFSKAKNICSNMPKRMKRMGFRLEAISDIGEEILSQSPDYEISDELIAWKNRFQTCDEIILAIKNRINEIKETLFQLDQKVLDIRHEIELESNKNMYEGYLMYVELREVLRKRRKLKDENLILKKVLNMNFSDFSIDEINETVSGLSKRKYTMRIVDTNEEDNIETEQEENQ